MSSLLRTGPSLASTILGSLLSDLTQKPRSRAEWEARFSHWQKPASETEQQKTDAARGKVGRALQRSRFLQTRNWEIIPQGSYYNNTNVRQDSDVDLCVCLTDAQFVDGPPQDRPTFAELGLDPLPFSFLDYKNHIAQCLFDEFGAPSINIGTKAIQIHKDDVDKISVDVVPTFKFRLFGPRLGLLGIRGTPTEGVGFIAADSRLVSNFPRQHYANGRSKNDRTGRRYKRVVRILKCLRNHMADNATAPSQMRNRAKGTASFLIESLVYNCPDGLFGNTTIYDDVVAVTNFLMNALSEKNKGFTLLNLPDWMLWKEVNGAKSLFQDGQNWTVQDAKEFIVFSRLYMDM